VELKAKDKHGNVVPYHPHGKHWVDGTIAFDLPMQRLSELFNINQASDAGDTHNCFAFDREVSEQQPWFAVPPFRSHSFLPFSPTTRTRSWALESLHT
jgi:hypothetical protein